MNTRDSRNRIYNEASIRSHTEGLDWPKLIYSLGKEGKTTMNVANQVIVANALGGKFVGDKINGWDIEVDNHKIELKCNTTLGNGWSKGLNIANWQQKQGWTHLIHYLPTAFNDISNEDMFIIFEWNDRNQMIKWSNNSGSLCWSSAIYTPGWIPVNGKYKEKLEWIQSKMVTLKELQANFSEKKLPKDLVV